MKFSTSLLCYSTIKHCFHPFVHPLFHLTHFLYSAFIIYPNCSNFRPKRCLTLKWVRVRNRHSKKYEILTKQNGMWYHAIRSNVLIFIDVNWKWKQQQQQKRAIIEKQILTKTAIKIIKEKYINDDGLMLTSSFFYVNVYVQQCTYFSCCINFFGPAPTAFGSLK